MIHSDQGLKLVTLVFESLQWLIYLIDLVVDNLLMGAFFGALPEEEYE